MNARLPVVALLAAGLVGGCGSTPPAAGPRIDVTIGQQLIELKEAHEAGALSVKEYQRQKKQLIDNIR